jgi:hypothetical protein
MTRDRSVDEFSAKAVGTAAMMMLQSLILALIEKGLLDGDDVLNALEGVIEAQRAMAADSGGDTSFQESVLRILTTATEEVTSR